MKISELKALIKECAKEAVREVLAEQLQLGYTPVKSNTIQETGQRQPIIPVGPTVDYKDLVRQQFESQNGFFIEDMNSMESTSQMRPRRPLPKNLQNNPFASFITAEPPSESNTMF
jgi:hypothetical protein